MLRYHHAFACFMILLLVGSLRADPTLTIHSYSGQPVGKFASTAFLAGGDMRVPYLSDPDTLPSVDSKFPEDGRYKILSTIEQQRQIRRDLMIRMAQLLRMLKLGSDRGISDSLDDIQDNLLYFDASGTDDSEASCKINMIVPRAEQDAWDAYYHEVLRQSLDTQINSSASEAPGELSTTTSKQGNKVLLDSLILLIQSYSSLLTASTDSVEPVDGESVSVPIVIKNMARLMDNRGETQRVIWQNQLQGTAFAESDSVRLFKTNTPSLMVAMVEKRDNQDINYEECEQYWVKCRAVVLPGAYVTFFDENPAQYSSQYPLYLIDLSGDLMYLASGGKDATSLLFFYSVEAPSDRLKGLCNDPICFESLEEYKVVYESIKETYAKKGVFEWKINGVAKKLHKAKIGYAIQQLSVPFYTEDYKMQLMMYLDGNGIGRGGYCSLFVRILKGENDEDLMWPANLSVEFKLKHRLDDMVGSFFSDGSSSFQKPEQFANRGTGIPQFVQYSKLDSYVTEDDSIRVVAEIIRLYTLAEIQQIGGKIKEK